MNATAFAEQYRAASPETRRVVDRLLQHDADDRAWFEQLGPAYRPADVAELLRKSKQAVSADTRLLRLEMRSGRVGYPAFQFDGRSLLAGIAEVVRLLTPAVETAWTIASWLTSPQASLHGSTPHDLLRVGDVDAVVAAARQFAQALAA